MTLLTKLKDAHRQQLQGRDGDASDGGVIERLAASMRHLPQVQR